jgi:hypothetical protein
MLLRECAGRDISSGAAYRLSDVMCRQREGVLWEFEQVVGLLDWTLMKYRHSLIFFHFLQYVSAAGVCRLRIGGALDFIPSVI